MKKFQTNSILVMLSLFCVLSVAVPVTIFAATLPSLGTSDAHGIISSTFTNSNTALQTAINGDVCYTTAPVTPPITITGTITVPCSATTGTDQGSALADINSQACTSLGASVVLSGTYTPGCYSSTGSMDIALGTTVTLNGVGVYIFRSAGALTTGADSFVVLAGGASASDVFWAPVGATTLGAYTTGGIPPVTPTFVGNILDAAGITFGNFASLLGRAFAFGGTVTTDANTITVPSTSSLATLHVIKVVSNSNGAGTAVSSDFNLHVKTAGVDVVGSPLAGAAAPGTTYTLSADTYVVSEDVNVSYTQVFSGDCDASGSLTLLAGDDKTCTITNTDIPAPVPAPVPVPVEAVGRSGGGGGSQRITPVIGVSKIPNPVSLPLGPGIVTYDYSVWNVGGRQAMIDVAVNDDKCSPLLLISGDSNGNGKLDIEEKWNYSCAVELSTTTTNTVFAYGYSDDGYHQSATASAFATVEVGTFFEPLPIQNSLPIEYQEVGGVLVSDPVFPDTGSATEEGGSPLGLPAFALSVVGIWILSGIVIRKSRV
jgi:Ice-binding-like